MNQSIFKSVGESIYLGTNQTKDFVTGENRQVTYPVLPILSEQMGNKPWTKVPYYDRYPRYLE